jgi:hypothetical protein
MNPQRIALQLRRRKLTALVLSISVIALCVTGPTPGAAQSQQEEREFENRVPAHLPIKVKVKNPEKANDLENDNWLRDLEIEVKNTGDKPIYYLRLILFFIDVKRDSGQGIVYPLQFGRGELIDIANHATPEDEAIKPGETYIFKLPEDNVKGWNWYRTKVEKKPHPKKIGIRFSLLNYGDGTGFVTTGGLPVSEKKSSL